MGCARRKVDGDVEHNPPGSGPKTKLTIFTPKLAIGAVV